MDLHSPLIFQEKSQPALKITAVVTCLKSYSICRKSIQIHCLSYEYEYKKIPHMFLLRFVPLACFVERPYIYTTQSAD